MDKKAFKQKIESNRNRSFGSGEKKTKPGERKPFDSNTKGKKSYIPKTSKPKPTTYEAIFDNVEDALKNIHNIATELQDFVDFIYDLEIPEQKAEWFDDMIHKVGEYMLKRSPQLFQKRNIHAKYSITVNGFSIKLENNLGLDLSAKYHVEENNVTINQVYCAITVYGKINPATTVMLEESDTWKKKEYKKLKKPFAKKDANHDGYKKPYSNDKKLSYDNK